MSLELLYQLGSKIDITKINAEEREQIFIFRNIIQKWLEISWFKPTCEEIKAKQFALLNIRAHGGDGKKVAKHMKDSLDKAYEMAMAFENSKMDNVPQEIINKSPDDGPLELYPQQVRQVWKATESKEAEIFDRLYLYKIYDYADTLNGL